MRIIVGLGNPGPSYQGTRHNIGQAVVAHVARHHNASFSSQGSLAYATVTIGANLVALVLSRTWMNHSGVAVSDALDRFRVTPADLTIVYDDLDLPFGDIRIKTRGSAGGHNGLRSVLQALETDRFCRVKIGIGRPPEAVDVADYVLSPFLPAERETLADVEARAADALHTITCEGPAYAMNQFNGGLGRQADDSRPPEPPSADSL